MINTSCSHSSKYHFQQALAAHTNVPAPAGGDGSTAESTPVSMEDVIIEAAPDGSGGHTPSAPPGEVPSPRPATADIYKIKRKTIPCPHPGCSKQYKQVSGLRYHLTHVRPLASSATALSTLGWLLDPTQADTSSCSRATPTSYRHSSMSSLRRWLA